MKKFITLTLLAIMIAMTSTIMITNDVNATSAYDGVRINDGTLDWEGDVFGCPNLDIATTWYNTLADSANWRPSFYSASAVSSLDYSINNNLPYGAYTENGEEGISKPYIWWSATNDVVIDYYMNGTVPTARITGSALRRIGFARSWEYTSGCTPYLMDVGTVTTMDIANNKPNVTGSYSPSKFSIRSYLAYVTTNTQPEGYEGQDPYTNIPDLGTAPTIRAKVNDMEGEFSVTSEIPETGADKVYWFITYGTIEGTPAIQTWEGTDVPTMPLLFTFPYKATETEDESMGTYHIRAWYTDSEGTATSSETEIRVVLKDGVFNVFDQECTADECLNVGVGDNAISLDFAECEFSAEYPFIDFDGCINKVKIVLGIINMDKIKYGDEFKGNNTAQCHTLTVFDDWLNLSGSNKTVCPVFPQAMRDIITPFMLLGLGMITIGFLGKHGEDKG